MSLVSHEKTIEDCGLELLSRVHIENGMARTAKDPEVREGGLGLSKQSIGWLVVGG